MLGNYGSRGSLGLAHEGGRTRPVEGFVHSRGMRLEKRAQHG